MTAKIIDGKALGQKIRENIKAEVEQLMEKGIKPGLAVVLLGDNPASKVYVTSKNKSCAEIGMYSEVHLLPEITKQEDLLELIDSLNKNTKIHGILVQLPLPKHIDEKVIINSIAPAKDVDGFTPQNVGNLLIGDDCFYPCTPFGCMVMLEEIGIDLKGKKAVVVGRSNIVGKPIAMMLLAKNATVTICHSQTKNLHKELQAADIVVAAVGKPEMITGEMIKEGAVVLDVGINRLENGKLVGDVHFASVQEKAGWITPVPGGVGPMTITMLLYNTLLAAKKAQ